MKSFSLFILTLTLSFSAIAQDKSTINTLITEGIKLQDSAKYPQAIAKYKEALALDPDNPNANYEMAYTLFSSGSGKDAIPLLNKVASGKSNVVASAYDMLGSIYDDQKQPEKAIENFKLGIQANPNYQRIYYNLALTYYRNGIDTEGFPVLTKALQLDPGHASSHRLYAMMAMNNPAMKANSVLAYCNFLLLEPTTARSVAAFADLKRMLNFGVQKNADKSDDITVTSSGDSNQDAANMAISISASLPAIPGTSPVEQMEIQLKTVFSIVGELAAKSKKEDFFWTFYANHFYKLSKSSFMPVAARVISFTAFQDENRKWINEHQQDLTGLSKWESEKPRQ